MPAGIYTVSLEGSGAKVQEALVKLR